MDREVKLSHLDDVLEEFDYPIEREAAVSAGEDVTLLLADGTENLGDVVSRSGTEEFESAEELSTEIMGLLPRRAVGEPYQSEGEG